MANRDVGRFFSGRAPDLNPSDQGVSGGLELAWHSERRLLASRAREGVTLTFLRERRGRWEGSEQEARGGAAAAIGMELAR